MKYAVRLVQGGKVTFTSAFIWNSLDEVQEDIRVISDSDKGTVIWMSNELIITAINFGIIKGSLIEIMSDSKEDKIMFDKIDKKRAEVTDKIKDK